MTDHYICADRIAEKIILDSMPSKYSLQTCLTERAELNRKITLLDADVKLLLHKLESGAIKGPDDIKRAYQTIKGKQNALFKARVHMMKLKLGR